MAMSDPDDLIDAIVTALRSISTLTSSPLLAAGADSILPYYTDISTGEENLEQSLIEQRIGTIIVYWKGTGTGVFAKKDTIRHDFGISLKPKGRVGALFLLIRDGVCTTSDLKFKLTQVDPNVRPPENMKCENRTVFMADRYALRDFSDITFSLTERGIDD